MSTRVLLADDHQIVREGLRALVDGEHGMQVIGEAGDGREAVALTAKLKPDIVIMDVAMPGLNGIEATHQIVTERPGSRVLALSMHSRKRFVEQILKAGAAGYLLKDKAFEELATAMETVMAGRTYLSPQIMEMVLQDYLRRPPEEGSASALTEREREVLQLVAEGATTKQIAMRLHVSVKTIETHRRQIMQKLDAYSVAQLTKIALREGLTSLEI